MSLDRDKDEGEMAKGFSKAFILKGLWYCFPRYYTQFCIITVDLKNNKTKVGKRKKLLVLGKFSLFYENFQKKEIEKIFLADVFSNNRVEKNSKNFFGWYFSRKIKFFQTVGKRKIVVDGFIRSTRD